MDFVADALFSGQPLRTLTIVDNYTWECLEIEVDGSLRGEHFVAALPRLAQYRSLPCYIKADNNDSEFVSKALGSWAYENGLEIDFSRPDLEATLREVASTPKASNHGSRVQAWNESGS